MSDSLTGVLALAAMGVGALHTIAPDHWVPFAALARAQGWSRWRTARLTALCGFGHVTASVVLGLLALFFGLEMLKVVGQRMEAAAGLLLIGFGLTYGVIGLRRAVGARLAPGHLQRPEHPEHPEHLEHPHPAHPHPAHLQHPHLQHLQHPEHPEHCHGHRHGPIDAARMTPWALFLLFSADPCVAVIPILFAAAPLGAWRTALVVGAYELATIGTMVALVLPAAAAAKQVRGRWVSLYGDAAAGAVIASVGLLVIAAGW